MIITEPKKVRVLRHAYTWKDHHLLYKGEDTGIYLILDEIYGKEELYRIVLDTGKLSINFYNLTTAKENAVRYSMDKLKHNPPSILE